MAVAQATVFGGSGFVGRYVVKRLAEAGARVLVGVRRPELAGFLRTMGDVGQVVPIRADLRDPEAVAAAVEGSDAVVNLVGILFERGAQRFAAIHAQGAEQVAKAAKAAAAARLVHVSAIGVDAGSASQYARSKAAGEAAVRAAFAEATVVRPSVVFGPEDDFFNRFAALARIAPALPLVDGGHTRFQPVYVGDLAEAVVRILDDPATAGATFELGGPRIYSLRRLLEYTNEQIGRKRLLVPVPAVLLRPMAWVLELLPEPPLTRDQLVLLGYDNVVSEDAADIKRFADLDIAPTPLEAVVPEYLRRYRRGGGLKPSRQG
jgi:NADH dehydrogenase